jgi:hypothetical protein
MRQLAKHVNAKFQLSSFYPNGLGQIFDPFSRKIPDFLLKKFKVFKFCKMCYIEHPKRHLLPKLSYLEFSQNIQK